MSSRYINIFVAVTLAVCLHIVIGFAHTKVDVETYHHNSVSEAIADKALVTTAKEDLGQHNDVTYNNTLSNDVAIQPRRGFGNAIDNERAFAPIYHLLVVFLVPPLLKLAFQVASICSANLLWMIRTLSRASRLSGWKESNLLYSHKIPSAP